LAKPGFQRNLARRVWQLGKRIARSDDGLEDAPEVVGVGVGRWTN
jgi:hypothetical protein